MSIRSKISSLIERSSSSKDFSPLENEKFFNDNEIAPYQLQHFWENPNIDDAYLLSLLEYENGKLFKSIFELFFSYRGELKPCDPKKNSVENWYQNILKFLSDNRPELLIQSIKESQCFLKSPYLKSLSFLENSINPRLKEFYKTTSFLAEDYIKRSKVISNLKFSICNKYQLGDILYNLFSLIPGSPYSYETYLNSILGSLTRIIPGLMNSKHAITNVPKFNSKLSEKLQKLLNNTMYLVSFKSDAIDVFCYDSNAIVKVLKNNHLDIKYISKENHDRWRRNGSKYSIQMNYYENKALFHASKKENPVPQMLHEQLQTQLFLKDTGLSPYDVNGFKIDDLVNFFTGLKSIEGWKENVITVFKKEKLVNLIKLGLKNTTSRDEIIKIIDWFTYEGGFFSFGQKMFIKVGDLLYLPSQFLQEINFYSLVINYIYNPKTNKINQSVSKEQAELLHTLFKEKMPNAKFLVEEKLEIVDGSNKGVGEIDLAICDGKEILILEIKGSAIRTDLKERHNLKETTLKKSNDQLRKLSEKFKVGSFYYNWLLQRLKIDEGEEPEIHYLTISTSFEWDDFPFEFPKYALFTLLTILRNDRVFFELEGTEQLFDITQKEETDQSHLDKLSDYLLYYEMELSIEDILKLLKTNAVWSYLNKT